MDVKKWCEYIWWFPTHCGGSYKIFWENNVGALELQIYGLWHKRNQGILVYPKKGPVNAKIGVKNV